MFNNSSIIQSPEMFLKNSIERIISDSSIKRKENAKLKKTCESALEQLNSEIEQNSKRSSSNSGQDILPNYNDFILADNYFLPFELACQSKSTKIVITALDCLQKLVAYGHLVGDFPDSIHPEQLLIDRVVFSVCNTFQGPYTDDAVQLQIIKLILALILSNTCKVHEGSLLFAVRTCFNIFLASRSPINQATAKGILTQTINAVFSGMERLQGDCHLELEISWDETIIKEILDSIINQIEADTNALMKKKMLENGTAYIADNKLSRRSSVDKSVVTNGIVKNNLAINGILNSNTTNLDNSESYFQDETNTARLEFKSVEEKDAFLIFRSLCKLSMKPLPDDPDPKSHECRSKLLSLEMILFIVQNFNMPLSDKHSFVFAIRHYLCVALTQNAVSPLNSVFEKALAIFVQLVNKLKVHLKRQIEVFFKEIIISILESASSSFEHKWVVLNTISKICDNSQSIMDIYVNYDCHLTSANIFQTLILHLSKIAFGNSRHEASINASNLITKERERRMRELGLECLIKVLKCLVVWYDELHIGKSGELSTNGMDLTEDLSNNLNGSSFGDVNQFLQVKQQKELIESGIELFAKKPKQGLSFLQQKGFVGLEHENIAKFFFVEERLDKSVVGDFLGDGEEFNKKIMYAYVDMFDFSGLTIVQALRNILEKFRLPGEAQKIDRIMEKFASRYCECNPNLNIFASADTAYVLSYSIIMLTTDLHNVQVRQKMTKEQYIKMNRGINDQTDLPDEFLSQIYDEIASNGIKTKPGALKPKLNIAGATWRQRKLFQNLELETMSQTAFALMEAASYSQTEFTSACHFDHVRPMFTLIWSPCLAAFSIGLQASDEEHIWKRCLKGFRYGIQVACIFQMSMQREAYIQALTRFTLLTAKSSLSEMKAKNVESIKLLITIGDEDGNFLDECWYECMKCISQLELAQSIGSSKSIQNETIRTAFNLDERSISTLQECLGEASSQSVIVAVDKIFQGSSKLSKEAIIHFVTALCRVSLEELSNQINPRMFMLQKIVEISSYNMSRIRIEWSMIWNVLGKHFNIAGCSFNEDISNFVLDSLRQLSTKFLEKGELPNFRLQKEFLRPFEVIMERNKSHVCREMVISCINQMVKSHADKFRSGWKNVFSVLTMAAYENRESIVTAAFSTLTDIMENIFPHRFVELMDSFQEAIKCLSEFACNSAFQDDTMNAINLILKASRLVSKNSEIINSHRPEEDHTNSPNLTIENGQRVWLKGWFPIIFELSCIINRCNLDVRTRSLTVMFEIIKTYGKEFRADWWNDLFNIIFRIFDFTKHREQGNAKNEWMTTTCNHALYAIVDVFSEYFTLLAPIQLSNVYYQLFWCIQQENEQLTSSAINCLQNLIIGNGRDFDHLIWNETVDLIANIFEISTPNFEKEEFTSLHVNSEVSNSATIQRDMVDKLFLEEHSEESEDDSTTQSIYETDGIANLSSISRFLIQMDIVDVVSNILFGQNAFKVEGPSKSATNGRTGFTFPPTFDDNSKIDGTLRKPINEMPCMFTYIREKHLLRFVDCLLKCHSNARTYSNYPIYRSVLWKASFKGQCRPNLEKVEAHSIHCALNILFQLFMQAKEQENIKLFRDKLKKTVKYALDYYLESRSDTLRSYWITVNQMILNRTCNLSDQCFALLEMDYRLNLSRLVESDQQPIIRTALHRFVQRALKEPIM